MQDMKGNGRLAQDKPILAETTSYPIGIDSESKPSETEDPSGNGSVSEFVRSYSKGDRDLAMANLYRANLQGAHLQNARLFMANLRKANLRGANLQGAKLRGADLGEADLRGANLGGADLRGADLRAANLLEVNLTGAKLAGAKLDHKTQIDATWRIICETINDGNNGHRP